MSSDKLSERISDLYKHIEDLKMKGAGGLENAEVLKELQASVEELSAADEELSQQNEELLVIAEENARLLTSVQEERDRLSGFAYWIRDSSGVIRKPGRTAPASHISWCSPLQPVIPRSMGHFRFKNMEVLLWSALSTCCSIERPIPGTP